jgi:hypothetical protein
MYVATYFNGMVCIVQLVCILFPETGDKVFAWVSRTVKQPCHLLRKSLWYSFRCKSPRTYSSATLGDGAVE